MSDDQAMASPFPDPEREWTRASDLATLDWREVEARIGSTDAPLELLSGGQANVNVRVGDRVLRIYRRDREARAKERVLLQQPWRTFITPAVLDAGDDFLLLGYVAHGPLLATPEHGAAVGRALAEIHEARFETSGWLALQADVENPAPRTLPTALSVSTPFGDVAEAFRSYASGELARATWVDEGRRRAVDALLVANADALRREAASPVLLHGDFKASNLHWSADDRLLVLDWEFAYAGPALMDIGQLLRWTPRSPFADAFADSYRAHGGSLPPHWRRLAEIFDLVNLAGLAANAGGGRSRMRDIRERLDTAIRRSDV
jgi:fructosamine-3-kinase